MSSNGANDSCFQFKTLVNKPKGDCPSRRDIPRPELCGTFHLTCEGEASWADFAAEIFAQKGTISRLCLAPRKSFRVPHRDLKLTSRQDGLASRGAFSDARLERRALRIPVAGTDTPLEGPPIAKAGHFAKLFAENQ